MPLCPANLEASTELVSGINNTNLNSNLNLNLYLYLNLDDLCMHPFNIGVFHRKLVCFCIYPNANRGSYKILHITRQPAVVACANLCSYLKTSTVVRIAHRIWTEENIRKIRHIRKNTKDDVQGFIYICLIIDCHREITRPSVASKPTDFDLPMSISHRDAWNCIYLISWQLIWVIVNPYYFIYLQIYNISRILGNEFVDHSYVVGASPVGAAPNTSSFST